MPTPEPRPKGTTTVRWVVLALLFLLAFTAYLLRMNVSVAGKLMMDELGLSKVQLGWVLSAFVWGYAIFQFPGGLFGKALGPRKALTLLAIAWGLLTLLTGLLPGALSSSTFTSLATLIALRALQGVAQAPYFPTQAGAVEAWFPPAGWALPNSLVSTGLGLGAAITPPGVAWLMLSIGWRASFYVAAPAAFVVALLWWWIAWDDPAEQPRVGHLELSLIQGGRKNTTAEHITTASWWHLLKERDTLLLALSYLCMNYVFYIFFSWFFIYLVDVRGFGILGGGMLASTPFIVGSVAAAAGGAACDGLCKRLGPRWGCRWPAVSGLVLVALFLFAGAAAPNPYWAIALLSLCFAGTQFTEGAYWAGQTFVAGRNTAPATGILNTGGNLGGAIATPLVPILAERFGWFAALSSGSVFALIGAALWFFIRIDRDEAADHSPEFAKESGRG
jgi:ACS family glucarate transporter-like MFS transporter